MARKRILVIEHDPFVAATIGLMLESFGFRATAVHDGPTAREILAANKSDIRGVVLTATLDRQKGPSIAEQVGRLGLPLVMVSGNDREMNNAADLGLQLLRKPFRREAFYAELITALSSGIAGRRQASLTEQDFAQKKPASPAGAPDPSYSGPRQWRLKAEELRAAADQMKTPRAQQELRRMAQVYDALADRELPLSDWHEATETG